MALPVVLVATDLREMTLVTDGATRAWTAPRDPGDDTETAPVLRQRVTAAAAWLTEQPELRKRIGIACLDVNEGICTWIQAPSDSHQVVHATLRDRAQEWGESWIGDGVEVLTGSATHSGMTLLPEWMTRKKRAAGDVPEPAAPTGPNAAHLAVLSFPDAMTRLWHDALDSRGVRIDLALSLWHAIALVWSEDADDHDLTATILIEPGERVVWTWSRVDTLVAAGAFSIAAPDPDAESETNAADDEVAAAIQRLILDWLTWSSQLGATPNRLLLVGPDTQPWNLAITRQWPDMRTRAVREAQPTRATVTRLQRDVTRAIRRERRSAFCMTSITGRPTRSVRRRFLISGAALLLLAAAIGGLGFRLSGQASAQRDRIADARAMIRSELERLNNPEALRTPNPKMWLESEILKSRGTSNDFKEPYPPRPLFREIRRVTAIVARHEGVTIQVLTVSDTTNNVRLEVPGGVPVKERIIAELRDSQIPGSLRWTERTATDSTLNLFGEWTEL
ncbi:MAG: hypothetical protein KDA21_04385 [Phycisphaerales bacterium]|nr:hypothetical protein [Phycisphaerales bacterium]